MFAHEDSGSHLASKGRVVSEPHAKGIEERAEIALGLGNSGKTATVLMELLVHCDNVCEEICLAFLKGLLKQLVFEGRALEDALALGFSNLDLDLSIKLITQKSRKREIKTSRLAESFEPHCDLLLSESPGSCYLEGPCTSKERDCL